MLACVQLFPCILYDEGCVKYCRFGDWCLYYRLCWHAGGQLWERDKQSLHLALLGTPASSLAVDMQGSDCCHREQGRRVKEFLLGAVWRIVGEHLALRGNRHLSSSAMRQKRQDVINVIGIVNLVYSFILQWYAESVLNVRM